MYTSQQVVAALEKYDETKSVTTTVRLLGYPAKSCLYRWITLQNKLPEVSLKFRGINTPEHPKHPSVKQKHSILDRCFELGEDVKPVSDEVGYSRASIYSWRRKYLRRGTVALMNPTDKPRGKLIEGESASSKEIDKLKAKMLDMQMEIDILKATIDIIKKDQGVSLTVLKNREKTAIADALKERYALTVLLAQLSLSRSVYYYQKKKMGAGDKYGAVRLYIRKLFKENRGCYGNRRIQIMMKRASVRLSEKIIRMIMKADGLTVKNNKKCKYNSYKEEITPEVPNIIARDFHA